VGSGVIKQWFLIGDPSLPGSTLGILSEMISTFSSESVFTISSPSPLVQSFEWAPFEWHEGRRLSSKKALKLIDSILTSDDFWCILESRELTIYPHGDIAFVGSESGIDFSVLPYAEPRGSDWSPIDVDVENLDLADASFWDRAASSIRERGFVPLSCFWSYNRVGSEFFLAEDELDIEIIQERVVSGSRVTLINDSNFLERPDLDTLLSVAADLGARERFAQYYFLKRSGISIRLHKEHVFPCDDLTEESSTFKRSLSRFKRTYSRLEFDYVAVAEWDAPGLTFYVQ
jgi:hypothetical protein